MPNYAKVENGIVIEFPSYPHTDFPQTSFGEDWQGGTVDGVTYVMVEIENTPATDYLTQDTEAQTPAKIDGKWIQKIKTKAISAEEKAKRKADKDQRDADQEDNFLTKAEIKAIRKILKAQG